MQSAAMRISNGPFRGAGSVPKNEDEYKEKKKKNFKKLKIKKFKKENHPPKRDLSYPTHTAKL
jgi:hypothetical protein